MILNKFRECKDKLIAACFDISPGIISEARQFKDTVLDILYPNSLSCAVCGCKLSAENKGRHGVCAHCGEKLPVITHPYCGHCGKPLAGEGRQCHECDGFYRYFEQAVSVFEYTPVIQKMIYRFKYSGKAHLGNTLGGYITEKLLEQKEWKYDLLVAVPVHKKRLRERGYNQSLILADFMSHRLGMPVAADALIRTVDTPAQAGLGRQERLLNLKNAFSVRDLAKIKGRSIVLVDDVYTTGSTANECSRVLLEAGAIKAYVLTAATGRPANDQHQPKK